MPSVKDKVFKSLTRAIFHRRTVASGYSSTLAAAVAAGASSITVVANPSPNLVNGNTIKIGNEPNRISGSITGAGPYTIPLAWPLTFGYALGETVEKFTSFDYGDIGDGGVTAQLQGESTDIRVSTRRTAYTILNGYQDLDVAFAFPHLSIDVMPIMFGMLQAAISGSGSVASPRHFATDGNQFSGESGVCALFEGVLMDGTIAYLELWNCDADYAGVDLTFKLGELTQLPVKLFAQAGVSGQGAHGYTLDTSLRPTSGKVLDSITDVGLFVDETSSPLNQTVAGATAAAGQKVAQLSAVTNAATGDLVGFDTGKDRREVHEIDSVSAPNITLRTNLFRDQAVGVAVKELKRQPFEDFAEDGASFNISGETNPIRTGNNRVSLGRRPGPAVFGFDFAAIQMSLANQALALAIAQSQIANNRLPITGANVGQSPVDSAYLRGKCQDGSTFELRLWGVSQQITNFAMTWNNTGQPPSVPLQLRPTSGIQVLNYT